MRLLLCLVCFHAVLAGAQTNLPFPARTNAQYSYRQKHDPDGIGKFYEGREIAQVMGHEGADWLERPEREQEEHTIALVQSLELKPGEVVADIGAGTGYLSRKMAPLVRPTGKVLAVDIQPEMLRILKQRADETGATNVMTVLGTEKSPNLPPNSVNLSLLVDVYHEFEYPFEMMAEIVRALRPGGRVVLVEYRGEDPNVPIKEVHKMTESQVKREMALHPVEWERTIRSLPRQNIFVFRKSAALKEADSGSEAGNAVK